MTELDKLVKTFLHHDADWLIKWACDALCQFGVDKSEESRLKMKALSKALELHPDVDITNDVSVILKGRNQDPEPSAYLLYNELNKRIETNPTPFQQAILNKASELGDDPKEDIQEDEKLQQSDALADYIQGKYQQTKQDQREIKSLSQVIAEMRENK